MTSSLRAIWLSVKGSYWFIPSLLTLFAFVLGLVTIELDRSWGSEWLKAFSWFEEARAESARAQLTVITSAMIAISSTLFAITIAAVAFASGNYGPRLLNNFMNDRGNQVSLGVFIATFVYNLLLLRVVRDAQDPPQPGQPAAEAMAAFVPQLSMLLSAASAMIAVAVLVYFLHHIPASIRINTVLGGIGKHLIAGIEERFPVEGGAEEPFDPEPGKPVTAKSIGYIEIVDFAELDRIAKEEGVKIALQVRTGDFLHPHLPMVEVSGGGGEKIQDRIRDCFSLGESRTPTQDLEFLIDELVEIGVRALSPGINDPFTAVTSVHWLGAALAKLADRNLYEGPEQDSYDRKRVQPLADDFGHFVRRGFGAFRSALATSPIAAAVALDALAGVAFGATSERRRAVLLHEGRELMRQAELELEGPALEAVRERLAAFETCMERVSP